jgi:carbon-monoxide dehydrogenase large subunit
MNAVVNALRAVGVHHLDMPATPARIWAAVREAASGAAGAKTART